MTLCFNGALIHQIVGNFFDLISQSKVHFKTLGLELLFPFTLILKYEGKMQIKIKGNAFAIVARIIMLYSLYRALDKLNLPMVVLF